MPALEVEGTPGSSPSKSDSVGRVVTVGTILLGVGLGGFFDGIVLHQILQWHHMLSAHTPPDSLKDLELNTLADGLFHGATWVLSVVGVLLVWNGLSKGASAGWARLLGGILTGWGAFNVVEGFVDHHLLGVHHVRPGPDELVYDVGFIAWGAAMLAAGIFLLRDRTTETARNSG